MAGAPCSEEGHKGGRHTHGPSCQRLPEPGTRVPRRTATPTPGRCRSPLTRQFVRDSDVTARTPCPQARRGERMPGEPSRWLPGTARGPGTRGSAGGSRAAAGLGGRGSGCGRRAPRASSAVRGAGSPSGAPRRPLFPSGRCRQDAGLRGDAAAGPRGTAGRAFQLRCDPCRSPERTRWGRWRFGDRRR